MSNAFLDYLLSINATEGIDIALGNALLQAVSNTLPCESKVMTCATFDDPDIKSCTVTYNIMGNILVFSEIVLNSNLKTADKSNVDIIRHIEAHFDKELNALNNEFNNCFTINIKPCVFAESIKDAVPGEITVSLKDNQKNRLEELLGLFKIKNLI